MKVIINRDEFIHGLARAHRVADQKSTIPILANVLLEAEEPYGLRISATDLHLSVTGVVPAKIKTGGSTTVAARTLFGIVKNLPKGDVTISRDEDHWFKLKSGRVHYRIVGIPAEDFPGLPSAEEVDFFCLDSELLKKMIEGTYFAISSDGGRPHLNGALFKGEEQDLLMAATDGHRLCVVDRTVEKEKYSFSILVPLKGIQEFRRLLNEGAGDVEVGVTGSHVFFRRHLAGAGKGVETETTLSAKLVDASFPPYERIIPKSTEHNVSVDRAPFVEALKRVSLITRDKVVSLQLVFSEGKITATSDNPNVGEASEEIDAQYEGGLFSMLFNGQYILEALSAFDSDVVELSFNGPRDACMIKPSGGDGFIYVVMPMKP